MLVSLTAKLLHVVMLKKPLNLFMAENNSESVDVDPPHSNTVTPGTVTCLPVAAVRAGEWRSAVGLGLWSVIFRGTHLVTDLKPLAPPTARQSLRLVRLLAAGQKNVRKQTAKNNTYKSKIIFPTLYKVRNVNISLHCKFRSGAWRHRADFQDSLVTFENAIIDIP